MLVSIVNPGKINHKRLFNWVPLKYQSMTNCNYWRSNPPLFNKPGFIHPGLTLLPSPRCLNSPWMVPMVPMVPWFRRGCWTVRGWIKEPFLRRIGRKIRFQNLFGCCTTYSKTTSLAESGQLGLATAFSWNCGAISFPCALVWALETTINALSSHLKSCMLLGYPISRCFESLISHRHIQIVNNLVSNMFICVAFFCRQKGNDVIGPSRNFNFRRKVFFREFFLVSEVSFPGCKFPCFMVMTSYTPTKLPSSACSCSCRPAVSTSHPLYPFLFAFGGAPQNGTNKSRSTGSTGSWSYSQYVTPMSMPHFQTPAFQRSAGPLHATCGE